jgi:hypothetical protein
MSGWTIFRFLMTGLFLICLFYRTAKAEDTDFRGISYGSPESYVDFHGFIDLSYFDFKKEGPGTDLGGPGTSTFDQENFYLSAAAKVRENVTAIGEVEYRHGGSKVNVKRAFVDWILPDRYLALRIGKFYAPFGLEIREYQAPMRKLVSRPRYTQELLYGEWSDTGVNAYGSLGGNDLRGTYDIAVVNGPTGLTAEVDHQNQDNNSRRAIIGRLGIDYQGPVEISAGGSYADGTYDTASRSHVRLSGVDAKITMGGMDLRGEYVSRHGDNQTIVTNEISTDPFPVCPSGPPCVITRTTTIPAAGNGIYGQASYRFDLRISGIYFIEAVYRHDVFNPEGRNNLATTDSIGINYAPYPHLVLKTEYQINREDVEVKNNGYLVQLVVDF